MSFAIQLYVKWPKSKWEKFLTNQNSSKCENYGKVDIQLENRVLDPLKGKIRRIGELFGELGNAHKLIGVVERC
jgi:hypothetical protein